MVDNYSENIVNTKVYVNNSKTEESLLDKKDAERLGIIQVRGLMDRARWWTSVGSNKIRKMS